MANCNSSSSTSAVSMRQSHGPPCHCGRVTNMLMSWTDANPERRFYKCEEHGFVIWADDEKPGAETVSDVVDHEIFQEELLKREKMLRQMFAMSWGGFILMTGTIIYMLKN
ncbi:uncharacterized protein LOC125608527 [Brassica napus]|uniref:uncharacterized protein LOC125608527 n=1 Tax=Brassica napus TaxID=3708 RepID=UPI002078E3D0|nr:uncharacterized protein LOC125608527 [Brassica napus]